MLFNHNFGYCEKCGASLKPILFTEIEYEPKSIIPTGRKRTSVSHLYCEMCGHNEIIDDSFDGDWHY